MLALQQQLAQQSPTNDQSPDSAALSAWCRAVFMLLVDGGIAGFDCLEEIFCLRFQDVNDVAGQGLITIPRENGYYPIYRSTQAALYVLSLCIHLRRGRGEAGTGWAITRRMVTFCLAG